MRTDITTHKVLSEEEAKNFVVPDGTSWFPIHPTNGVTAWVGNSITSNKLIECIIDRDLDVQLYRFLTFIVPQTATSFYVRNILELLDTTKPIYIYDQLCPNPTTSIVGVVYKLTYEELPDVYKRVLS